MRKNILRDLILFLALGPLWPAPVDAFTPTTSANAYMVENTSGTDTSGNFCYDFQTKPSCSARITNLTATISSSSLSGGSTFYIQNTITPTTTSQVFSVSSATVTDLLTTRVQTVNGVLTGLSRVRANNFDATGTGPAINGFAQSAVNFVTFYTNTTPVMVLTSTQTVTIPNSLTVGGTANVSSMNVTTGLLMNGSPGVSGQVLTSNGPSTLPTYQAASTAFLNSTNTWTAEQIFSSATITALETNHLQIANSDGLYGQIIVSSKTANTAWAFQGIVRSSACTIINSSATTTSAYVPTNLSCTIIPRGTGNNIRITMTGGLEIANGTLTTGRVTIAKAGVNALSANGCAVMLTNVAVTTRLPVGCIWQDPASTTAGTAVTYSIQIKSSDNTTAVTFGSGGGEQVTMILDEIGLNP